MRKLVGVFLVLVFCFSTTLAHISLIKGNENSYRQDAVIKTEKVSGNIYVLFGQGGNIGVSAGKDGILMIDDQFARIADNIKAALKNLGSETPRFLFNTHFHGDHTGGNPVFGKDSLILAHANVRKRLSMTTTTLGGENKPLPEIALPIITYNQEMSVFFNGEEVHAVYFPNGHTDGDTVIFFTKSNVVHLGDDFFVGKFPFVDLDNGGNVQGLIRNIGELIKQIPSDAKLIPGHGTVSNLNELKNYHQTLLETTDIVRKQMAQNKSLEDIKKTGFPEKYKDWGTGFIKTDRWIETIYKSYSMNMMDTKKSN